MNSQPARRDDEPPVVAPVGALGDIGAGLFATIGLLAALRQRDRTGQPQRVDVAMLDAVVAMTDIVSNYWSLGLRGRQRPATIFDGFRAADGWFVLQVGREPQFRALGHAADLHRVAGDEHRLLDAVGAGHLDQHVAPLVVGVDDHLVVGEARPGGDAGPAQLVAHVHPGAAGSPRLDRGAQHVLEVLHPALAGGEPRVVDEVDPTHQLQQGPETRVPWLGEHTDQVLAQELGLDADDMAKLRADGVVA